MSAAWTERLREAEALVSLRGALEAGEARDLSGLHGSARLLVALLASDRPLVVVVPSERDVDRVASDLRFFCGELGERRAVRPFPSPGPAPFRGLPRHAEASLQRAAALHGARRGRLRAVVASPIGLMRPVLAPEFFSVRELELRRDEEMMPELLLEASRRRRLPGQRSGRGAGGDGASRRHPRFLPARAGLAGAARVSRRHDRDPAQLRPRLAAKPREPRSRRAEPRSPTSSPPGACSSASGRVSRNASATRARTSGWSRGSNAAWCPKRWSSCCRS